MKIKEIVAEGQGKLRKSFTQATPGTVAYDALDNNNHPYLAYRFGIALAVSPNDQMDSHGPIGSDFAVVDYSKGDEEIRRGAEKILGVRSKKLSNKGSKETDTTGTQSPVAQWMKPTKKTKKK